MKSGLLHDVTIHIHSPRQAHAIRHDVWQLRHRGRTFALRVVWKTMQKCLLVLVPQPCLRARVVLPAGEPRFCGAYL
jgi:hypothetical protein